MDRAGLTLPELLLVLLCTGLLAGMAVPGLKPALDRLAVEHEACRIADAHARARETAIRFGRRALLDLTSDSLRIRTVEGADTVLRWRAPGPGPGGVALDGPARPTAYAPIGIAVGVANATWRLTRGAAERRVVVSRLGRVRVERD